MTKDFTRIHNAHQGKQSILAHVLFDHYNPPSSIRVDDWQQTFRGEDNRYKSNNRTISTIASQMQDYAYRQSEAYVTGNVLVMWGDDFSHVFANNTYDIADRVMEHMMIDSNFRDYNYTIQYSSM